VAADIWPMLSPCSTQALAWRRRPRRRRRGGTAWLPASERAAVPEERQYAVGQPVGEDLLVGGVSQLGALVRVVNEAELDQDGRDARRPEHVEQVRPYAAVLSSR